MPTFSEKLQSNQFDTIADAYHRHYGDHWSLAYRRIFIAETLLEGLDLNGRQVIDAMCGNGENTRFLMEKGARVTGIDISGREIETFKRKWPQCRGRKASILNTELPSDSYDAVFVVGGLHHVQPHCVEAIREIQRLLKKGGYFCFMEPHAGSLPDMVRKCWYPLDRCFQTNEFALDITYLKNRFATSFEFVREVYRGNIAYLLVLNSLIFRMPLPWKKYYAQPLLQLERLVQNYQTPATSCFVICQWKKN